MYTNYFGYNDIPFQLTPDHRFFFHSATHDKALAHLTFGISQGEGFIVITGEVGAGKTTLLGHLLATLDQNQYVTSAIVTSRLQGDDVLRLAALNFGLNCDGLEKAQIIRDLEAFLTARRQEGRRCLLMVDEAQNLSVEALEELRMLSNLQSEQKPLLQSFLLAQPQFKAILARADLEQLRQRVIAAYHLRGLDAGETRDYVMHRMKAVGWNGDNPSITDGAFEEIHEATQGIPRVINNLCSRVLLYGCLEELKTINAETVKNVAEDQKRETAEVLAAPGEVPAVVGEAKSSGLSDAEMDRLLDRYAKLSLRITEVDDRLSRLEGAISHGLRSVLDYVSEERK